MIAYLVRRIARAVSTLLGTTLILFVLVRVVPRSVDTARAMRRTR